MHISVTNDSNGKTQQLYFIYKTLLNSKFNKVTKYIINILPFIYGYDSLLLRYL